MSKCGVCNCRSSNHNPLYCASCVNFQLLKPKLEYLELLKELTTSKSLVDKSLDKCIKGNNYPFIKNYIAQDGKLDSVGGVSIGSIAALSSQLLTIDAILLKRKNNKIMKEISIIKSKKDSNTLRLESLKKKLDETLQNRLQKDNKSIIKSIKSETDLKKQDCSNIQKQVNNSQSILFQELINLYLIKKRKLSGTNQNIFMISFIPMINIKNLIVFNHEVINTSLERICKFISQVSKIWFINLPYKIEFNKEHKPRILNFELSLPKNQQLWELSTFELKLLLNGISRLILNIFQVLKFFEMDFDIKTYNQLFRMDEMIYKIVNNNYKFVSTNSYESDDDDDDDGTEKKRLMRDTKLIGKLRKVDIDDLTEMIYGYISNKINKKNNEWHLVKKEYLIDEE